MVRPQCHFCFPNKTVFSFFVGELGIDILLIQFPSNDWPTHSQSKSSPLVSRLPPPVPGAPEPEPEPSCLLNGQGSCILNLGVC